MACGRDMYCRESRNSTTLSLVGSVHNLATFPCAVAHLFADAQECRQQEFTAAAHGGRPGACMQSKHSKRQLGRQAMTRHSICFFHVICSRCMHQTGSIRFDCLTISHQAGFRHGNMSKLKTVPKQSSHSAYILFKSERYAPCSKNNGAA
jgi:hypothetical protein